jgi:iron complex outermembrane recepter protein
MSASKHVIDLRTRDSDSSKRLGCALVCGVALMLAATAGRSADGADQGADAGTSAPTQNAETTALDKVTVKSSRPAAEVVQAQQDIPKSVSVVTGSELESLDALNITEIFQRIGNIQWNFGNPMTGSLSIRGVTNPATGTTVDPSLGVVVDGVTYAFLPLTTQLDYVDVATVSVTRGPQGSTGGQNNSLGTITVTNNAPTFTPEAHAQLILGELNAVVGQAAVGGPVIDDLLAWRATFYRDQQQGAYNNGYLDNKGRVSWDNADRTLGRLQFLLTPRDDLSILASVTSKPKGVEFTNGLTQYTQEPYTYANGAPTYIPNGPGATNTAQNKLLRGYFVAADPNAYANYLGTPVLEAEDKGIENGEYGGLIHVTWDLANATVNSVSAYENSFFQASNGTTEWDVTSDGGVYALYRQESEELSIQSKPGGFLDYKTGLFYLQSSSFQDSRSRFGSDAGAYDSNWNQYAALAPIGFGGNATDGDGLSLLENSLDRVYQEADTWTENRTAALFGSIDWHLSQPLTLTTGLRFTREDRQTTQFKGVTDNGFGADLNPLAYGGFGSTGTGALLGTDTPEQIALANQVAEQYFGVATYSDLTAAQLAQVAAAKAIRSANAFNQLYPVFAAQPYQGTLPTGNIALSYKFSPDLTSYLSWQHGAKAGISQVSGVDINGNPISRLVNPETSNDWELGLKGGYFHDTLIVNADIYLDYISDYQQTVTILDPVLSAQNGTNTYTSITGNAPGVELQGLEVDAVYTGVKYLTLRFAGDYSNAFYDKNILIAKPVEDGNQTPAFYNAKGLTLYDAPHFSGNLSGEYAIPISSSRVFHTNFNYHYTGPENADPSHSEYAWVKGYGLLDLGVGVGRRDRKFDVNLLVKNALNTGYNESQTWASYIPGIPRWFGVAVAATL